VTKAAGRSPRGATADVDTKDEVLERLRPEERARVLSSLLERRPELVGKARQIARAVAKDVDLEAVAGEVEWVLRLPELDDLQGRAGGTDEVGIRRARRRGV
jgi:hypothetical protein